MHKRSKLAAAGGVGDIIVSLIINYNITTRFRASRQCYCFGFESYTVCNYYTQNIYSLVHTCCSLILYYVQWQFVCMCAVFLATYPQKNLKIFNHNNNDNP